MSDNKNSKIRNIENIFSIILAISIVLFIAWYIIIASYNKPQFTYKSFNDIQRINNELTKISSLDNIKYETKEELLFNIKENVNLDLFNKYYYLFHYDIIDYKRYLIFSINFSKLENISTNIGKLNDFSNKKYEKKEEIENDIKSIIPKSKSYDLSSYYSYKTIYYYSIQDYRKYMIPEKVISSLKAIINKPFKSETELNQAIMRLIGVEQFNINKNIIDNVYRKYATWIKTLITITILLFSISVIALIIISIVNSKVKNDEIEEEINNNIEQAKKDLEEYPKEALPVWELANNYLQKYYNENLKQIKNIFVVSIGSMILGFILILGILIIKYITKAELPESNIGIIAGIITEFIGATFLFIYKSTIRQALEYSKSLEKINNIGMSIKILQSLEIEDINIEKVIDAKIEISKKLIDII